MAGIQGLDALPTRKAYGVALVELGEQHDDVVALDCDLAVSTQSVNFGKRFPERFFNMGAAEANMMSVSCGLAVTGKIPYASTFAVFATGRSYDQIRLSIAHNELPVRICASHGGLTVGEDGASHQMIEDIALMRAMPHMQVIVPADYNQAYAAIHQSYDVDGPVYIRLGRPNVPQLYAEPPKVFGAGADVLREGSDISIFATGHMVARALDAADLLQEQDGVAAEVVNIASIKPLDTDVVVKSIEKTGVAITSEEHRVVGGLADAIREAAAENHPVRVLAHGVGDEFGRSGKAEDVMQHYGLTADGIAARAREALSTKS